MRERQADASNCCTTLKFKISGSQPSGAAMAHFPAAAASRNFRAFPPISGPPPGLIRLLAGSSSYQSRSPALPVNTGMLRPGRTTSSSADPKRKLNDDERRAIVRNVDESSAWPHPTQMHHRQRPLAASGREDRESGISTWRSKSPSDI